jgi:hypothetical protein
MYWNIGALHIVGRNCCILGLMIVVNIIPFSKGISTEFCTGGLGGVILDV